MSSAASAPSWSGIVSKAANNQGNPSRSLNFPTPFLDFEKNYLPRSVKELFDYITFCFISDSNVKPALENLAAYGITSLVITPKEKLKNKKIIQDLKKAWLTILEEKLDVRVFCILMGLDYFAYGSAFASVYKPFVRYLECEQCKTCFDMRMKDVEWRWNNLEFELKCSNCKNENGVNLPRRATLKDVPLSGDVVVDEINLIRWPPQQISIKKVKVTGKVRYFYDISSEEKTAIVQGDKDYLMHAPAEFIEAVRNTIRGKGKLQIEFGAGDLFAMQRPTISMPGSAWDGWGLPTMIASLRDIFFKNIMRRAQATVLHEHTIPLRIFSPSDMQNNPVVGGSKWQSEIVTGYRKWLGDPTTIITSPVPINVQQFGGEKGSLSLFAETQVVNTDVIKGFGVPREFVEGALTYSGGNVSIRMLENLLMDFLNRIHRMLDWLGNKQLKPLINLAGVEIKYKPFKMADDIQLKQLMVSVRQSKEISAQKLGEILDYDASLEQDLVRDEDIERAINSAVVSAKSSIKAQKLQEYASMQQSSMASNFNNPVPPEMIDEYSMMMSQMPPEESELAMQNLQQSSPITAKMLSSRMDMSPQGLMKQMQVLMSTPEPQRAQAFNDLMRTNPAVAQMFQMMQQMGPPQGNPQAKQNVSKPAPVQRPPISTTKSM